jgi:hypothetical protein
MRAARARVPRGKHMLLARASSHGLLQLTFGLVEPLTLVSRTSAPRPQCFPALPVAWPAFPLLVLTSAFSPLAFESYYYIA